MVNTIAFLLIVFGIMFLIGIAMAILALYFNIKMKHPIFSIIFSTIVSDIFHRHYNHCHTIYQSNYQHAS